LAIPQSRLGGRNYNSFFSICQGYLEKSHKNIQKK